MADLSIITGRPAVIMNDNPITNITDYVQHSIKNYFIQPAPSTGIGGIRFDIVGDETLQMDNDVTDHYLESNIAYQNQISLKPITFTMNGYIGELVYLEENQDKSELGFINKKLNKIVGFLPATSSGAQQAKNRIMRASNSINTADNYWERLKSLYPTSSKQQLGYIALRGLRDYRTPINITTPWSDLTSYVITSVVLKQPERTAEQSQISITLKEFRETELTLVPFVKSNYQERAALQGEPNVEQGQTNGRISTLSTIGRGFGI